MSTYFRQLSETDRSLLEWLEDHPLATTGEIAAALPPPRRNILQRRLIRLYGKHLIGRLMPLWGGGKNYRWQVEPGWRERWDYLQAVTRQWRPA